LVRATPVIYFFYLHIKCGGRERASRSFVTEFEFVEGMYQKPAGPSQGLLEPDLLSSDFGNYKGIIKSPILEE